MSIELCFFFQAEDGIRDLYVTGVQTCALPIFRAHAVDAHESSEKTRKTPPSVMRVPGSRGRTSRCAARDRKSTRLNSSHVEISYAVFCLKKKKKHRVCNQLSTPLHSVVHAHLD